MDFLDESAVLYCMENTRPFWLLAVFNYTENVADCQEILKGLRLGLWWFSGIAQQLLASTLIEISPVSLSPYLRRSQSLAQGFLVHLFGVYKS